MLYMFSQLNLSLKLQLSQPIFPSFFFHIFAIFLFLFYIRNRSIIQFKHHFVLWLTLSILDSGYSCSLVRISVVLSRLDLVTYLILYLFLPCKICHKCLVSGLWDQEFYDFSNSQKVTIRR